ncbi:Uncharacterized protein DBV15_09626 [Temnothorax longispinosus]|uniref:Uncharacterized protein n=1 Tax=Temnothorax longispinosus TaxID=300112 RepID=A0A4S2L6P6_9HYME|nr:Uncharacterized protein DBV15_09626 [Temnothorax longispinosus]
MGRYSGNHSNWKSSNLSRNNETFRQEKQDLMNIAELTDSFLNLSIPAMKLPFLGLALVVRFEQCNPKRVSRRNLGIPRVVGRGDPPFPDSSVQMGRIASAHTYEATRHRESAPVVSIERMQIRLKLLEDSNATLTLRNRDLIAENKSLTKRSEFELLEKDMRTLRDAVIARKEAWDKAVERERNCQQQLARLTAEAITARHLCETRQDELRAVMDTLTVMPLTDSSIAY